VRQSHLKCSPRAHSSGNAKAWGAIQTIKESTASKCRIRGRFEIYRHLKLVYRVYVGWKNSGIAKRAAHALARDLSIKLRRGRNALRILIEATMPKGNLKQKSRWVRALEYIYSERVPTKEFRKFVRRNGGLAGCARLAVSESPKWRRSPCDSRQADWDD
jgi:hypothetical protein